MLEKVEGITIDKLPFEKLRLVADLIYYDGPLLSSFRDNQGHHYLYYCCDADDSVNRWLVFRISQESLRQFLTRQLTLHELILKADPDHLYLIDLGNQLHPDNIVRVQLSDLPQDYLPDIDTGYDASLSIFHDEQAVRDLIVLMQRDVQAVKTKLKLYEEVAVQNPDLFRDLIPTP
jgi:hypothetical protein